MMLAYCIEESFSSDNLRLVVSSLHLSYLFLSFWKVII